MSASRRSRRKLKKLEDELGVALVERDSRGVILTSYDMRPPPAPRRILLEIQQLKESVQQNRNPEAGTIRSEFSRRSAPICFPMSSRRPASVSPDLELLLIEEKSGGLLTRLRDGEIDAAIRRCPSTTISCEPNSFSRSASFLPSPIAIPSHGAHRSASGNLADHDLMLLEDGHCLRDRRSRFADFQAPTNGRRSGRRASKHCDRW